MKTGYRRAGLRTISTSKAVPPCKAPSLLSFNTEPVCCWTGMWGKRFLASPKSLPTHQTPSASHSAALKILSSSASCLKESSRKVCESECAHAEELGLHGAAFRLFSPSGRAVKPLTALDSPAIWPLGGCSEMNSADPVAQWWGGRG